MCIIVYTFIGMSKLFNIDNMNMDGGGEMEGGASKSLKESSDEDITELITEKFINQNNIKSLNDIMNEMTGLTDKNKEGLIKYFTDNKKRNGSFFESLYNKIRGVNETPPPGETEPKTGQPQTGVEKVTTTAPSASATSATGNCIHIGIIDETGTFVGVKSVPVGDPSYSVLQGFVTELREKNKIKIEEAASIYDKFVKSDTGCIPQFVTGYQEKFCNSKELLDLAKIAGKTIEQSPAVASQAVAPPAE